MYDQGTTEAVRILAFIVGVIPETTCRICLDLVSLSIGYIMKHSDSSAKRDSDKNLNGTDREVICEAIARGYSALVDSRRAIHRIGPLLTTHSKHTTAQRSDF